MGGANKRPSNRKIRCARTGSRTPLPTGRADGDTDLRSTQKRPRSGRSPAGPYGGDYDLVCGRCWDSCPLGFSGATPDPAGLVIVRLSPEITTIRFCANPVQFGNSSVIDAWQRRKGRGRAAFRLTQPTIVSTCLRTSHFGSAAQGHQCPLIGEQRT